METKVKKWTKVKYGYKYVTSTKVTYTCTHGMMGPDVDSGLTDSAGLRTSPGGGGFVDRADNNNNIMYDAATFAWDYRIRLE